MLNYNDIAILYRTNAQSGPIQKALKRVGIPYKTQGGMGFWQQREVKDLLAFLSWIVNPVDTLSLERAAKNLKLGCAPPTVINRVFANIDKAHAALTDVQAGYTETIKNGEKAVHLKFKKALTFTEHVHAKGLNVFQVLEKFYKDFSIIDTLQKEDIKAANPDICREDSAVALLAMAKDDPVSVSEFLDNIRLDDTDEEEEENGITLSTIHKAKGLEWSMVFIVGCSDSIIPSKMTYMDIEKVHGDFLTQGELRRTPEYKQELNAMYVAQTRAENVLVMVHAIEKAMYSKQGLVNTKLKLSPLLDAAMPVIQEEGQLNLSYEGTEASI